MKSVSKFFYFHEGKLIDFGFKVEKNTKHNLPGNRLQMNLYKKKLTMLEKNRLF